MGKRKAGRPSLCTVQIHGEHGPTRLRGEFEPSAPRPLRRPSGEGGIPAKRISMSHGADLAGRVINNPPGQGQKEEPWISFLHDRPLALCRFPPPARSAAALFRGGPARAQAGLPAVLAGGGLAALPGRVGRLAGGRVEGASGAGGGQHAVSAVSVGRGPEPGFQGAVDGGAAAG